jgi:hypothetical protein
MRKLVAFITVFLLINTSKAQIVLTTPLIDSIVSNLYNFKKSGNYIEAIRLLNFSSLNDKKKSIFVSSTSIINRKNIHESMMIYITDNDVFFVVLRNVVVDSVLCSRLVDYNDARFEKALDSINFPKYPLSGLVLIRSPLEVFRIRKKLFKRQTYVITSKKYIPYLSAPEEFIPLKEFVVGGELNEIEPWYYDRKPFKELNKKYYEDMKPSKKIILKMPKKQQIQNR